MGENFITIGEVVNTQGHKGEVRVIPTTDFPERFKQTKEVNLLIKGTRKLYHIEQTYEHKKFIIVKFSEIPDMNGAETLKGALLQIPQEQLMPLPEGSYYIFQITGLPVFDVAGNLLGEVKEVLQTGANDVYVVRGTDRKEILIPALKHVIKKIDLTAGKITVDLPEGL